MSIKMLTAAGFAIHAFLSNFCMMPMAFAQGMEVPREEHMAMTMTPMLPMSSAHCEHCVTMQSSGGDQSRRQSGCAGHCFSRTHNTIAGAAPFNDPHIVAAAPISITIALAPQPMSVVSPPARAPPTATHTDTIVLRL